METKRGETCLRVLAETELRRALTLPREPEPDSQDPASARSCLARLRYMASALKAVGAVEADIAEAIEHDLEAALVVRHRLMLGRLNARPNASANRLLATRPPPAPYQRMRAGRGPGGGPAESARAMPIGRRLLIEDRDMTAEVCLISMTRTGDREIFAVTAWTGEWPGNRPFHHPFGQMEAVDELGDTYHVHFNGGFGEGRAEGWLTVQPVVPPGLGWLELHSGPGTPRLRVDITAPSTPVEVRTEPHLAAGPGERLLDSIAADLLISLATPEPARVSLDDTVMALEETGVLAPGNLATSRLAELCRQAGLGVGPALVGALLAGRIPPAELPDPWTNVVAYYRRRNRPAAKEGMAVIAAALPELDGVRFVATGLASQRDDAILTGMVFGLFADHPHRHDCTCWIQWFPWWIRDSAGQWHVAAFEEFKSEERESATFALRVVPPIPASATWLDVIITGPSRRTRLRMPVEWMAVDG
ncbi:MAG: hypothetical protein ACRDNF_00175 [Streptosporangiaceae bacterium]